MEGINAILRYRYGVDPDTLPEEEWLRLYAEYRFVRKRELKELEITVHNALAEIVNKLFGKDNGNSNIIDDTMDN